MIYTISGNITHKKEAFVVVDVSGIGLKVALPKPLVAELPDVGAAVHLFSYLHVREDALELYGFLRAKELELFEKLISISGIGPKSAMGILAVAPVDQLVAAINEGRTELLTRVSGVGKKTSERVILELKGKLTLVAADPQLFTRMESDAELEELLVGLGYSRAQARATIGKIDPTITDFKLRLKEALKKK